MVRPDKLQPVSCYAFNFRDRNDTRVSRIPVLCLVSMMSCKVNVYFPLKREKLIFFGTSYFSWNNVEEDLRTKSLLQPAQCQSISWQSVQNWCNKWSRYESSVTAEQSKRVFIEESTRRQSKHKPHPASVKSNCITFYRHAANIIE